MAELDTRIPLTPLGFNGQRRDSTDGLRKALTLKVLLDQQQLMPLQVQGAELDLQARRMQAEALQKQAEQQARYQQAVAGFRPEPVQTDPQRPYAREQAMAQSRLALAQQLRASGLPQFADKEEAAAMEALKRINELRPKFGTTTAYHPETGAEVRVAFDERDPTNTRTLGGQKREQMPWEYEVGPDGQPRMRQGVLAAKTSVSRAGAPSVSVKVDNKMGESLAGRVGPILEASQQKASGAVKMAQSAQRIIGALDSGGVIAGPGASWIMRGAQVADMLGVGGKDNAAKIANTRQVIRGLSESAVEARKELAGQGQVTENEAKAVEKAMAGNIDDLTPAEIRLIAGLNIKAAKFTAQQHQKRLEAVPEEMRSTVPFFDVDGIKSVLEMPEPSTTGARPPLDAFMRK